MSELFFTEEQTPNVRFSLRVRERLLTQQTPYQLLEVLATEEFGNLMALDGKVMLTERDEMYYHEMLAHPALLSHPLPRRVLVIGGGDGGTVREVLRHPTIEEVLWCEIDEAVIDAAREFFPTVCAGVFDDARVQLHVLPGETLMAKLAHEMDVILVDSTDPIGPAVPLFEAPFFAACQRALRAGGSYATQSGSPFYFRAEGQAVARHLRRVFRHLRRYWGMMPTYPSGVWSYALASDEPLTVTHEEIARRYAARGLRLSYYTPEIHAASAVIPPLLQ
ncbi:MAG: polyamine aminopropyltransferase [Blastocatellia bacterium]